jgi:hypothetical protein
MKGAELIRSMLSSPLAAAYKRFQFWRQQMVIWQFAQMYYDYPLREDLTRGRTWQDGGTSWLGIPCEKCPLDLWIYQELIFRTRPDVILECGVFRGGSTLYLASLLDLIGQGQVVGVDITLQYVAPQVKSHPRISLHQGSSTMTMS